MRPSFPRIILILSLCLVVGYGFHSRVHPGHLTVTTVAKTHGERWIPNPPDEVATAQFLADRDAYFAELVAVAAYLDALEQGRLAAEAEAAALAAQNAVRTVSRPAVSTVTGGDCAPVAAIIGWGIVNRESGGNPNAANPSGAFGCSQTLLSHYNGGICSGLDPYTVAGQAACTQILYDRAGLSPWAQTR